jgi:hypothetical protein
MKGNCDMQRQSSKKLLWQQCDPVPLLELFLQNILLQNYDERHDRQTNTDGP